MFVGSQPLPTGGLNTQDMLWHYRENRDIKRLSGVNRQSIDVLMVHTTSRHHYSMFVFLCKPKEVGIKL